VLTFIQQIPFVPPPPPPPAQIDIEHNDDESGIDIGYEAENNMSQTGSQKVADTAYEQVNVSTNMQLQKLEREQRTTLEELQSYAKEQRLLTEKL
jgi:peroxiredoxin family protein